MKAGSFEASWQRIVRDTLNIWLNGGDGGRGRGKIEVMLVVAGSRIDDLGMVPWMVLDQGATKMPINS